MSAGFDRSSWIGGFRDDSNVRSLRQGCSNPLYIIIHVNDSHFGGNICRFTSLSTQFPRIVSRVWGATLYNWDDGCHWLSPFGDELIRVDQWIAWIGHESFWTCNSVSCPFSLVANVRQIRWSLQYCTVVQYSPRMRVGDKESWTYPRSRKSLLVVGPTVCIVQIVPEVYSSLEQGWWCLWMNLCTDLTG